ncbi:unnamed protein product [Periconia digitata]|uniref:Uncharacterized protein n=1 Tax=Periconia digitata TaxID=1303443 RepID=A0A9W4XV04_9PLEO|nr:unnamed protein product [Periconia digitata]
MYVTWVIESLKPLTGIREVPVANCNNRDFCSASQLRMHCKVTISAVVSVLLPVVNIDIRDTTDQKLQLSLVEHIDQLWRNQFVEAGKESVELFLDPFLDAPFGYKTVVVREMMTISGALPPLTRRIPSCSRLSPRSPHHPVSAQY